METNEQIAVIDQSSWRNAQKCGQQHSVGCLPQGGKTGGSPLFTEFKLGVTICGKLTSDGRAMPSSILGRLQVLNILYP